MARFFYNLLLVILFPVLLLVYSYRLLRGKESFALMQERWGNFDSAIASDPRRPRFWVHAVSVGEVMAATPVLRELRSRYPDALIVLSVTTTGGREVAQSKIPLADYVVYFPFDFPLMISHALQSVRPDALLLMEWEIWPNLLSVAKQQGATVAVINGRISDKGLKRGRGVRWFLAPALQCVDIFAMQSAEDADRAVVVGAEANRVQFVGNTKFDESVAMVSASERDGLRRDFGIPEGAPVWICGSTRDAPESGDLDEEVYLAEAFALLRKQLPNLHLILAPRHLERADAAAKPFAERGFVVGKRSAASNTGDVLLLDTFGELARAYAVADVAFVGGSLVKRGGQSVFQPLAQGVPAVFGPYMNNQRDIAALAQSEKVGFVVANVSALVETVQHVIMLPPDEKFSLSQKCRTLIERNQGVTARALDLVHVTMTTVGKQVL